ncbi:helix-turn-helix domain-containing protein [Streptomyces massasporeus]|uniref:helix-turn-helix domain-containing protein n=1 Tax=Streptomyces massasporeus TaxID=67324 RepID=UPI0036FE0CC8
MGTGVGITAPFGRLLRGLRQSRRLTIEELAEASGISGRAIGDMERGRSRRPHRGTITALAQGLELDEAAHADLLAAARAARPGARPAEFAKASPHTLPRGVRDFVGRQAELTVLRALAHEAAKGQGVAPPAAVVSGPPGRRGRTLISAGCGTPSTTWWPRPTTITARRCCSPRRTTSMAVSRCPAG